MIDCSLFFLFETNSPNLLIPFLIFLLYYAPNILTATLVIILCMVHAFIVFGAPIYSLMYILPLLIIWTTTRNTLFFHSTLPYLLNTGIMILYVLGIEGYLQGKSTPTLYNNRKDSWYSISNSNILFDNIFVG